jgi:hypothetical protein
VNADGRYAGFWFGVHFGKLAMNTTTLVSIAGKFMEAVGEVLADIKRRDIATIDVDLLNLKRTVLRERLQDFKSELITASQKEKARAEQDLISRGLSNSTVLPGQLRAIEQDAATGLEKALREYNRAIEELALIEQKINAQAKPWWKRLCR